MLTVALCGVGPDYSRGAVEDLHFTSPVSGLIFIVNQYATWPFPPCIPPVSPMRRHKKTGPDKSVSGDAEFHPRPVRTTLHNPGSLDNLMIRAGLPTFGSSSCRTFPSYGQWLLRHSSPITAAGPWRNYTAFPVRPFTGTRMSTLLNRGWRRVKDDLQGCWGKSFSCVPEQTMD